MKNNLCFVQKFITYVTMVLLYEMFRLLIFCNATKDTHFGRAAPVKDFPTKIFYRK